LGQQVISKFNEVAANVVNMYIWILRLPNVKCDIMVTLNDPIAINPQSSSANTVSVNDFQTNIALFQNMISSFQVLDWNLFENS